MTTNPWLLMAVRWGQMTINPHGVRALGRLPRYARQWLAFARAGRMKVPVRDSYPCLADATDRTSFDAHYVLQAAWLCRQLARRRPARHVDVGSSVQMIVGLSAFVDTLFIDYRPIAVRLDGLECRRGDVLDLELETGSVPSLSCLHVIEHVGLGRYGEPLDPEGSAKAAAELARVLAPGGSLFVSVPVGRERICFNAHRVFAPATVLGLFEGLALADFAMVDDRKELVENATPDMASVLEYGCGLFRFEKPDAKAA